MRLFVDEDTGAGLARALRSVGVDADYIGSGRPIRPGTPDEISLPRAGREGRLVFSRNTGILVAEAQRQLVIEHQVGLVFLPQHLSALSLLRLVLSRWERLEELYGSEPRPFAKFLSAAGRLSTRSLS